jgi:PEP-CTERM motif
MKTIVLLFSAVCLAGVGAQAQNLLLNGDFNSPNSGSAPDNWTTWSYGNGTDPGWANHENAAGVSLDGSYYMVDGGYANCGGGEYQMLAGTEGVTYQLSVESGADAWWLPYGEMRLFFFDAANNQLEEDIASTVDPAVYGQNYDIPHPWASYSMTATAPVGTTQIKVEFASPTGTGSVWFENAVLTAVPEPGALALAGIGLALLFGRSRRS